MATSTGRLMSDKDSSLGDLRSWIGRTQTVGGVASFFPTTDGTINGEPLFSNILTVIATAGRGTADPTQCPLTSFKSINANNTRVDVNCVTGVTLSILGATVAFVPDGTPVHCLIFGV